MPEDTTQDRIRALMTWASVVSLAIAAVSCFQADTPVAGTLLAALALALVIVAVFVE